MTRRAFSAICAALALAACAKQGQPPGGPEDRTPPEVIETEPLSGTAQVDVHTPVTLSFSEPMKREDVEAALNIFPAPPAPPDLNWDGQTLAIEPDTVWAPDQTYVVTLQVEARDRRGNRLRESLQLAFSTGEHIDSASIGGSIWRGEAPVAQALALCYRLDRLNVNPELDTADYVVQVDSAGRFRFDYLSPGVYRVFGLEDRDRDWLWNIGVELLAVPSSDIDVADGSYLLPPLFLTPLDTVSLRIESCQRLSRRYIEIQLDGPVDSIRLVAGQVSVTDGQDTYVASDILVVDTVATSFVAVLDSMPVAESAMLSLTVPGPRGFEDTCSFATDGTPAFDQAPVPRLRPDSSYPPMLPPSSLSLTFDRPLERVNLEAARAHGTPPGDSLQIRIVHPMVLQIGRADGANLFDSVTVRFDSGAVTMTSGGHWPPEQAVGWRQPLLSADSTGTYEIFWSPGLSHPTATLWLGVQSARGDRSVHWVATSLDVPTVGRLAAGDYRLWLLGDEDGDRRKSVGWPQPFVPAEALWPLADTLKVRARFTTELELLSPVKN